MASVYIDYFLLYISPKNKKVKQNVDANPTRSQHQSSPTTHKKDNDSPLQNRDLIIDKGQNNSIQPPQPVTLHIIIVKTNVIYFYLILMCEK